MESIVQQACLFKIQELWSTTKPDFRPYIVWIAEHEDLLICPDESPESPVKKAWLLGEKGIEKRPATDYVRFMLVHSGVHWYKGVWGAPSCGIFGTRPYRIHNIGLAAFAAIKESKKVYLDYIWGGGLGCGAEYKFDPQRQMIEIDRIIWR